MVQTALSAPTETFQPNTYPFADSLYKLGSTTQAWLQGSFDELCLLTDCRTIWPSGGGGAGSVGTSTVPTIGQVPFWTTSGANPELLGSVATTSLTNGSGITFTGTAGALIGGSNLTITLDATGDWTGTLDSIEGANFLRSDIADTAAGLITLSSGFISQASSTFAATTTILGNLVVDINTNGNVLVGDGTSMNSVIMSGDATIASDGTVTVVGATSDTLVFNAKVSEAAGITKGQVVFISGATGGSPQASLASRDDFSKTDVIAMANETKTDGQTISVTQIGLVENIDTSIFTEGEIPFLGFGGNISNLHPTSTHAVIRLGNVVKVNASTGSILFNVTPGTIVGTFNGTLRDSLVNLSNGSSAVTARTALNDVNDFLSIGVLGGVRTGDFAQGDTFIFASGNGEMRIINDGNEGISWWTDVTDTSDVFTNTQKMRLSATGRLQIGSEATTTAAQLLTVGSSTANRITTAEAYRSMFVSGEGEFDGQVWIDGTFTVPALTSALTLTNESGDFAEYTGTTCTNQFTRALSVLGVATCESVITTDITDGTILEADLNLNAPTDNFLLVASSSASGGWEWVATSTARLGLGGGGVESVTANNSTLTISPTTGAVLAELNLSNANTWLGAQSFTGTTTITAATDDTVLHLIENSGGEFIDAKLDVNGDLNFLADDGTFRLKIPDDDSGASVGNIYTGGICGLSTNGVIDSDTCFDFDPDGYDFIAGNVAFLGFNETTQNLIDFNPGSVDIDYRFETDNLTILSFTGSSDTATANGVWTFLATTTHATSTFDRIGIGTTDPQAPLHIGGSGATSTMTIGTSTTVACLKMRDTDGAGWTYGTFLNGVVTWSTTACNI